MFVNTVHTFTQIFLKKNVQHESYFLSHLRTSLLSKMYSDLQLSRFSKWNALGNNLIASAGSSGLPTAWGSSVVHLRQKRSRVQRNFCNILANFRPFWYAPESVHTAEPEDWNKVPFLWAFFNFRTFRHHRKWRLLNLGIEMWKEIMWKNFDSAIWLIKLCVSGFNRSCVHAQESKFDTFLI